MLAVLHVCISACRLKVFSPIPFHIYVPSTVLSVSKFLPCGRLILCSFNLLVDHPLVPANFDTCLKHFLLFLVTLSLQPISSLVTFVQNRTF